MPDPDAALKEIEYAYDTLKTDGISTVWHGSARHSGSIEPSELPAALRQHSRA